MKRSPLCPSSYQEDIQGLDNWRVFSDKMSVSGNLASLPLSTVLGTALWCREESTQVPYMELAVQGRKENPGQTEFVSLRSERWGLGLFPLHHVASVIHYSATESHQICSHIFIFINKYALTATKNKKLSFRIEREPKPGIHG